MTSSTDQIPGFLLASLYAVLDDRNRWPRFLHDLCDFTGSTFAELISFHFTPAPSYLQFFQWGLSEEAAREFYNFGAYRDRWMQGKDLSGLAEGAVVSSTELCSDEVLEATECYQGFLEHRNLHYGACAFLLKSDRICTVLGIMRSKESGRLTSAELDRIRSLVPHVQRVLRIQDNASDLATQRDLLHGVVDHAAVGLILLEKNGTFLMANNRARAVLDRGTLLRTEHGLLRAASKNDDRALQDSIQRTLQRFQKTPGAEIVPLGQATSDPEVTGPWLRLLIVPAQNGGTPAPSSASPAAIVHIVDPAAPPRVDREMLRRVFSLEQGRGGGGRKSGLRLQRAGDGGPFSRLAPYGPLACQESFRQDRDHAAIRVGQPHPPGAIAAAGFR